MYCSNAEELLTYLLELKGNDVDLRNVSLNFRFDNDSDVEAIYFVSEDLFDAETNSVLESIVFLNEIESPEDWEDNEKED